jgi:hypothetical protein
MKESDDIFNGYGIEILLAEPNDFLKIKETLQRIGICSKKDLTLYQSCHILHKKNRYSILHFKELFALDGKDTNVTSEDIHRRNTITKLLLEWDLLKIKDLEKFNLLTCAPLTSIKVLSFAEKKDYTLQAKYTIGKK